MSAMDEIHPRPESIHVSLDQIRSAVESTRPVAARSSATAVVVQLVHKQKSL
jgi:hypothetical protein